MSKDLASAPALPSPSELNRQLHLPSACGLALASVSTHDAGASYGIVLPTRLREASMKRQREFLAGRYCALRALQEAGCTASTVPGVLGRSLPDWPIGWTGSISHCNDLAIAVAAPLTSCASIGIDVEGSIDSATASEIACHVALPGEQELLLACDCTDAIGLLFSAKEALYKALYPHVGRFFDFSAARLRTATAQWLELELCEDWSAFWCRGRTLRVHYARLPGHVVTSLFLAADKGSNR